MPFKGGRRQMRAMFAKGGKSAAAAKRWAKKYGVPRSETGRKSGKKGKS